MGRKKPSSRYNSLTFTRNKPDKSQPTISQSFNKAKEYSDKMDDSDDDVEIITSDRSARVERRHKAIVLEQEEQENEEALLQQQEEADLQRAIELSRMEACASGSQEWYTNDVVPHQSQAEAQMNMEDADEDVLLGQEDESSNEDKKSVKSEILLDSDNEEELPKERESEAEMGYNSSRVSDGSSVSVTFPGNHLQRPIRKEGETVDILEDVGEDFEGGSGEVGVDEAGSGQDGRRSDEFNFSQDLFSPGCRMTEQEKPAEVNDMDDEEEEEDIQNTMKPDDSDEDFVPADEDDIEEDIENRKTSRLSVRKRKREVDETSAPSKTLKVTSNLSQEDYEGETLPMSSSDSQKEEDAKQEIENLVNGPFSLVQSEQLEERLHDNRVQTEPSRPFYAPSVADPQDYSVVIFQMIECCLKQIRQRRFHSAGDRCWGNPVRPGPHLAKYLILRRRGVRIPPSDEGSSDETTEGEVSDICGQNVKKDAQVCEDSDEDFEPLPMAARRQADSHRPIKRPRSEPRESDKMSSHSIVCPKPIRRDPNSSSFQKFSQGSGDESAFQEPRNSKLEQQRPPTPSVRTFEFGGSQSPNFHGASSKLPSNLRQEDVSEPPHSSQKEPSTPVRKLRRSSSNPEFRSPSKDDFSPLWKNTSHFKEENKAGPSKQVAQVRPRNSSPWLSKASFKNSSSHPNSQTQLEGGFIRDDNFTQVTQEEANTSALDRPSTSEDGLKPTNPPSPSVPSPPKIVPSVNVGIECPLCGQKYPISTIEAHASECDGSIPLDDEIDISDSVTEEPVRSSVIDSKGVHQKSASIPRSPQNVCKDQSMDHIDAAILQLVENKEINLVASRNPQSKSSRSLKKQFEDVFDEDDYPSRLRGNRKKVKEDLFEKCYLCSEMIPRDDYSNHVSGHKELAGRSKFSRDSSEDPPEGSDGDPVVDSAAHLEKSSPGAVSNGSPEEHNYLRAMYGKRTKNSIEDEDEDEEAEGEEEEEENSLDWTQPGMIPEDSDSPIKAYQSISESRSIIDFKNQFKEASNVRSRADVRGRGRGRGRGTKRRRGKVKRGRGRRKAATLR